MSKKLCKESDGLDERLVDREMQYSCTKCDKQSPKEKWCCKPKKIKQ
ncbi:MAG: hypothetical protein KAS29_01085 [Bacteroidales bacterium]|nr:hypothetical protein [Bacteroidales bacterium]